MKHSGLFGLVRAGVGGTVVLTGFLLAGCATGPDAHPRDPLEPWNRGVFRFNDAIDRAFLKPAATVYTKATPQFAQKGVRNFFGNLVGLANVVAKYFNLNIIAAAHTHC